MALLYLVGFLVFATCTDCKPAERELFTIARPYYLIPYRSAAWSFYLEYYYGSGAAIDFFYKEGTMERLERDYIPEKVLD